jgi:hypothetical protein
MPQLRTAVEHSDACRALVQSRADAHVWVWLMVGYGKFPMDVNEVATYVPRNDNSSLPKVLCEQNLQYVWKTARS